MIKSTLENEIVDLSYRVKPSLKETLPEWKLREIVKKYHKNIIINRGNKGLRGVALFLKVNDRYIENILNGNVKYNSFDELFLIPFGENILFIGLIADGFKTIRDGIRKIINKENPKSIGWFNHKKERFFVLRRR